MTLEEARRVPGYQFAVAPVATYTYASLSTYSHPYFGNLGFFRDSLVFISANIDPDTEYPAEIQRAIAAYGQTAVTQERRLAYGGGYINVTTMTWVTDRTRNETFTLSLYP